MNDTNPRSLPSGRFVLRIDPRLHAALRRAAAAADLSLNEYCARKLAAPGVSVTGPGTEAVERAISLLGERLVSVVAFGSWARGELTRTSDVDLLLVVAGDVCLERSLYGEWDANPVSWEGHRVEPHFVHLPGPDERVSGLWAEAAVDGVVLFDRDLATSRRLVAVRQRIASGELVRRVSHGHAYWVEAA